MKLRKITAENYKDFVKKEGKGIAIFVMDKDGDYEFFGKVINEEYVALVNGEGRWFVARWFKNCFADSTSWSYSTYKEAEEQKQK